MLRKIKLYGKLAKYVGHTEFDVDVNSVGNAVSFLINNFPELETYMSPKYYQVKVGNYSIDEDEIHLLSPASKASFSPHSVSFSTGTQATVANTSMIIIT